MNTRTPHPLLTEDRIEAEPISELELNGALATALPDELLAGEFERVVLASVTTTEEASYQTQIIGECAKRFWRGTTWPKEEAQ